MESDNITDPDDNRDVDQSLQSLRSTKPNSRASSTKKQKHRKNAQDRTRNEDDKESCVDSRSKTRICNSDPDRDHMSDGEARRSSGSFYSDDYESPSERTLSPYSRSQTPSPSPQIGVCAKRSSHSPLSKKGCVGRRGMSRPHRPSGHSQHFRRGIRSQSKESIPPKDLDLVTKRMLSARLLKINELRNALVEMQLRIDELQKENRILRQLQVRQEKALQHYDDTESEISQLISRHNNETHVLRERLRRTQERERAAERRLKDSEEQRQRSQATIARMKKLVDQQELGTRDELSRKLEEERIRVQEAERKIKELERSMELTINSYQRQIAAERKKTITAQEETRTLQEELQRMMNKLKEKERELDTWNIYANRVGKPSSKKDMDSSSRQKLLSRSSNKAVQTEDRKSSPDFPTPPPAVTDVSEYCVLAPDEYLSLKELNKMERPAEMAGTSQNSVLQRTSENQQDREDLVRENDQNREQELQLSQDVKGLEGMQKGPRDGLDKEKEENRTGTSSLLNQSEDKNSKSGHVQEEVERWNQEALANQHAVEEARRKKEQLLAKMREIDIQNQAAHKPVFAKSGPSDSSKCIFDPSTAHPAEPSNDNYSVFKLTEPEESASLPCSAGSREGGRRRPGLEAVAVSTGMGRRTLKPQISSDDLAFGNYAPSFGNPAPRSSSGFAPPPPREDSTLEAIGVFSVSRAQTEKEKESTRGEGKHRKSSLMHQLFGAMVTSAGDVVKGSSNVGTTSSPPTKNGVRSRRVTSSTSPASSSNNLHITESRPAIRAITSFDEDIEELAL